MRTGARAAWVLIMLAAPGAVAEAQGPKPQASFSVGQENLYFAALTPDGATLITLSDDGGTVGVWDVKTGKRRHTIKGLTPPASSAVPSNDGKRLAVPQGPRQKGADRADKGGVVHVLDAATGKRLAELKGVVAALVYVEFSPDGKYLAGGEKDGRVRVWDAATGEVKAVLKGHAKEVIALGFSPDGKTLATGDAFEPGEIRLWDWAAKKQTGLLKGHPLGVLTLEFTQDGKTLLSSGLDGVVRTWDVATGKDKVLFKGGKDAAPWAAISPSGRTAAWTSGRSPEMKDKKPDAVTVINLVTGKSLASLKHADTVLYVAFAAGGRLLVTAGQDGLVQVWDVAALREKK